MSHVVTVLPGDGIGKEVVPAAMRVIDATGVKITWVEHLIGEDAFKLCGDGLSKGALDSLRQTKIGFKGPTTTPPKGHRSLNVRLRLEFDLYANIRPVRTIPAIKTRFSDVSIDIVIFRENLEDLYIGAERVTGDDRASAVSIITKKECERIAHAAFEYASHNARGLVTIGHKANILKLTHGMFLDTAYEVAKFYPKIKCNDFIADNLMMQLVQNPQRFDVLLLPNFLGDLVSDLCAGLVGGLGFAAGANIGDEYMIFEAVHGSAPDIAGKGVANPTAMILTGADMLGYLGERAAAEMILGAVNDTLVNGIHTGDISRKNPVGTKEFTDAVIARL
jgi:isocitrate dehydrogenase (NAD+)